MLEGALLVFLEVLLRFSAVPGGRCTSAAGCRLEFLEEASLAFPELFIKVPSFPGGKCTLAAGCRLSCLCWERLVKPFVSFSVGFLHLLVSNIFLPQLAVYLNISYRKKHIFRFQNAARPDEENTDPIKSSPWAQRQRQQSVVDPAAEEPCGPPTNQKLPYIYIQYMYIYIRMTNT